MNIKSLLLGSAAAMVAVSGAQAADAIVVEPEPVEYVRVCDAYGSGFFFIPGTETCIRLGGFVRSAYEKVYFDAFNNALAGAPTVTSDPSFTLWGQRARLNVDTRNETEYGTLRALYRLEGGQANTDVDVDMDVALISLAGFRAGFAGANYWSSNHGFGGVNAESV
ncbi:MAG: porin, partial [Pseudomonadota bacterium]